MRRRTAPPLRPELFDRGFVDGTLGDLFQNLVGVLFLISVS